MILLDTSGLLSAIDGSQRHHAECVAALAKASPPLLLSPFVLAELDYLLSRHVGTDAQLALLEEVARGAYQLEPFGAVDVAAARAILDRYASLRIGLADASIVVLAEKHGVREILTLDERHFGALRTRDRKRFKLLPLDR
ncbi:MAG TPA: PIN domain-containing protein [Steroidobacteraceae bacterium]|nr:PIN domain-containing protein [Steroidobacteraceae bacterium]